MASKQGGTRAAAAAAAGEEMDPKYEWQENATSYLLRVHLSGFRKEDFRVQVDGAGRLTVRGQRAAGASKHCRFHKVFQLPPTCNLDDISGRFEASVLTLTVPKRAAAPPATVEEIKRPAKAETDSFTKPKEVDEAKRPRQQQEQGKPRDEAKKQAEHKEEIKKQQEEVDAKRSKQESEKKVASPAVRKEEEKAPKAEAAAAGPTEKKQAPPEAKAEPPAVRKEEEKPKAEAAAAAATEKKQAPPEAKAVDRESLAERVRQRRAEEEREKAAAEEAERERKQRAACGGWKERVTEELEGIAGSEWAEGLVETVKRNKEVIAAIAALSIGLFVSSRLFSRN